MTVDKLKKAALTQFALHGYGAPMSLIAKEMGIRKQSIYSHFRSKEELFLSIFTESILKELDFINNFIDKHRSDSLKELLPFFLRSYLKRYTESDNTSFFLRTSFFPPLELEQLVKEGTNTYIFELEMIFQKVFQGKPNELREGVSVESAVLSFLTILDGLFVEMLYGIPERFEKKMVEVWNVYSLVFRQ